MPRVSSGRAGNPRTKLTTHGSSAGRAHLTCSDPAVWIDLVGKRPAQRFDRVAETCGAAFAFVLAVCPVRRSGALDRGPRCSARNPRGGVDRVEVPGPAGLIAASHRGTSPEW
jgi:hypothetical protein